MALVTENKLTISTAIDFVGTQSTFELAFEVLQHGGQIHIIGLHAPIIQVVPLKVMLKDLTLRCSFWGTKDELAEILQLLGDGKVKPMVEMRELEQCADVLRDMQDGRLQGRIALTP